MTAQEAHEKDVEARLTAECAKCEEESCPLHGLEIGKDKDDLLRVA